MDVSVQTGTTKSAGGTVLLSLSFTSAQGERVFLLLQIEGAAREAAALEEESTSILKHAIVATEGEAWHRLDGALKEFNGLFKGLLLSRAVDDLHAVVAILEPEGALHLSQAGRGEAYLLRSGSASQITEYVKGKPLSAFVHISSGTLEAGDVVVFSTQRLLRVCTPAQLLQLGARPSQLLQGAVARLESEREMAALGTIHLPYSDALPPPERTLRAVPSLQRQRRPGARGNLLRAWAYAKTVASAAGRGAMSLWRSRPARTSTASLHRRRTLGGSARSLSPRLVPALRAGFSAFLTDLRHPERRRRAHLLLLASAVFLFLIVWMIVRLSTNSQRSQTKAELSSLVGQITEELRTAENRHLAGDLEAANTILQRAEERAKQVMENESGLFRMEALNLLDRIHAKKEEVNNIVRLPPRVVVNLASKNAAVTAHGLIGLADGEFVAYDRQQWYHVLLNSTEEGRPLIDEELIIDGASFPRYKTQVFLTTGNSIVELIGNQPTTMKTDDPAGWTTGKDIETYLRFLYILGEEHIYKYERLSNRYGPPVQYDVNADLSEALDMTIDGNVYVLKPEGTVLSLFRGESKPFTLRHAPEGVLKDAVKIFKVPKGNFYFLDPVHSRIIVATDGGANGESSYVRQYTLEGDQLTKLQDLFVDSDESRLYVLDEKRLYVIDLKK